jgi:hypothetical protein
MQDLLARVYLRLALFSNLSRLRTRARDRHRQAETRTWRGSGRKPRARSGVSRMRHSVLAY